jgi:large subunit ribosomal protein L6
MSRIGRDPINLPDKVKAELKHNELFFEGPKGKTTFKVPPRINVKIEDKKIIVARESEEKKVRSLHGTIRALINNTVVGITDGFKKDLEIIGMGYKAQMKGNTLALQLGFSHPVEILVPDDLKVSVAGPKVTIEGTDKQRVGQFSAQIRSLRPPEPYKGKGIRYSGEEVRKKLGKAMTK